MVSVLDSHDVVIAEEEKKIENDITSKSNCEKLPPFTFYTCAHTHTAQEQRLDFPYFHRLHDDVVDELTGRCNDWKMKSESFLTSMDQREEEEEEDNDGEKRHIDDGGCRCLFVWVWVCQLLVSGPQTAFRLTHARGGKFL